MKSLAALLLLALAITTVFADDAETDVLVLDSESFEKAIDENSVIAVEFYAPWCGHCKALAPEWEAAATQLKGKVAVAKVDCTKEQALCQKYEIQGYPTLKLFRNGEASPLEVARKAEPIVAYLKAELEPAITVLKTQGEIDAFLAEHPVAAIGYFDNDHDDRYTIFDKLASSLRHSSSFGAVVGSELSPDTKRPGIVFHKNFDDATTTYTGEYTSDDIKSWLARQKVPALGEISAETYPVYMGAGRPIGYLFVNPSEDNTDLFAFVKNAAKKLKDRISVAWIDNVKYGQHGTRLGLSGQNVPSFVIDDPIKGIRHVHPESTKLSLESITQFFEDYIADKLQPHIKSEPIPEDNSGPVKTIVAHNFDSIVKDDSKHVLVEFYAPWCGHCKKLAPVWEELGQSFQGNSDIVIAKCDATANDVPPSLNIRGFPTILLFPAGQKDNHIEYQGSRSLDDLKSFVAQHTASDESEEADADTNAHDEL